jgi:hypothetical protein
VTSDSVPMTLRKVAGTFVGEPCIAVIAGKGTGAHLSIHVGEQVPRECTLTNPCLTETERRYDGSLGLFVECSWRLTGSGEFLTGSGDASSRVEFMAHVLETLVGQRICDATVFEPGLDLSLGFEGGFRLDIFCDNGIDDNYSLLSGHGVLIVGGGANLREELG